MKYSLIISHNATKQLHKLDKPVQERILNALQRILIRPRSFVTKLISSHLYRFRVGDYRVIMEIDDTRIIILVVEIGHRKVIYKYDLANK